jgi:DNA polymerase-1
MAQPVRTDLGLEIRKGFVCEEDHVLGEWDLDQVEMRVMAHISEDETMGRLFRDEKSDIHTQTAMWVFGIKNAADVDKMLHRYPAKRIGFGVVNGITGVGLHAQFLLVNITKYSVGDCDDMIKGWFGIYKGVKNYLEKVKSQARRYGYVSDMWGRVRYTPGIHSDFQWVREGAEREATNHMIQAGAQGLIKLAMAEIWNETLPKYWLEKVYVEPILQVHDSLLFEIQDGAQEIIGPDVNAVMCSVGKGLRVPIKSKFGFAKTWGDLEK